MYDLGVRDELGDEGFRAPGCGASAMKKGCPSYLHGFVHCETWQKDS